jgi:hypothetical protein
MEMTVQRFEVVGGQLVDRSGNTVGRIERLVVELDLDAVRPRRKLRGAGGVRKELPSSSSSSSDVPEGMNAGGGTGEPNDPVWAYWLQRAKPTRVALAPGTARQLARARKAGYADEQLKQAIDGLLDGEWWKDQPRLHKLSTIFATKPGGKTFEDQVDSFIDLAQPAYQRTPFIEGNIAAKKENVRKLWPYPTHRETVQADLAYLRRFGVQVVEVDGKPQFRDLGR